MAYGNPTNSKDVETARLTVIPSEAMNFLSEQDLAAALFLTSTERSRGYVGKGGLLLRFSRMVWEKIDCFMLYGCHVLNEMLGGLVWNVI